MSVTAKTALFAFLALVGFAANSLLCRAALRPGLIDASTFTFVRIGTGAVALALILGARGAGPRSAWRDGAWGGAAALFAYAAAFSFAYLRLSTGTGALILFGAVQGTMISVGLARGERMGPREIAGFVAAAAGLILLCLPGLTAPDPAAALLMAGAGAAWGAYSLMGRRAARPLATTAGNFLRSVPLAALALAAMVLASGPPRPSSTGLLLAALSGAIASGVGYSFWYAALPGLKATRAAVVQLAAPVFTAIGGVVLLGETVSLRQVVSTAAILGGISLVVLSRR